MDEVDAANEWQAAFDSISEWISIHDMDFKIVRANRALAEALHTTQEALIGQHCYSVICHSSQPCFGCPQKLVHETKTHQSSRVFLPNLGFYSNVAIWPLFGQDGKVEHTVHVIRDVAQYNRMDIDPTQGGVWFRKLANSLPYIAFELDNSGNLVFANPSLMHGRVQPG
jgi:PAS domain-containing protein